MVIIISLLLFSFYEADSIIPFDLRNIFLLANFEHDKDFFIYFCLVYLFRSIFRKMALNFTQFG